MKTQYLLLHIQPDQEKKTASVQDKAQNNAQVLTLYLDTRNIFLPNSSLFTSHTVPVTYTCEKAKK